MERLLAHPWWPWLKNACLVGCIAFVVFLLVRYARHVDWAKVMQSMRALPPAVLLKAILLAAVSHLVYSLLDLVGRHYTGHHLAARKVMQVSFTSYAFNLNLGSLVGGIGFRYRLYSRLGLRPGQITRIVTLSMITNWLGYILLAGLVFSFAPLQLPPDWKIDSEGLQLVGAALLALEIVYLGLAAFSKKRSFKIRGYEVPIPTLKVAGAQLGVSCTHWMFMAAVPWALLQGQVDYPTALSVLLLASIAGVMLHVPAGLGVTEAVYVALLSHRIPVHELIGALLAFRAIFYLMPLAAGALLYLKVEVRTRNKAAVA
jgi:uncharacterized membrane protein YbhN (UPF0104 family)